MGLCLHELEEQIKPIWGDSGQKRGYLREGILAQKGHRKLLVAAMSYILTHVVIIWVQVYLKSHSAVYLRFVHSMYVLLQ